MTVKKKLTNFYSAKEKQGRRVKIEHRSEMIGNN
jgi:hypothetical protein